MKAVWIIVIILIAGWEFRTGPVRIFSAQPPR